jgi:hypothetical protein
MILARMHVMGMLGDERGPPCAKSRAERVRKILMPDVSIEKGYRKVNRNASEESEVEP